MASSINPNNIDGSYPVAGQDNNSQGFRDNFSSIKLNFQYAKEEINDLETNAITKAALTGSTLDNNMNNNTIYAVNLNDVSTTAVPVGTVSGAVALNYATGQYQTLTLSNSISLSFTNWPADTYYGVLRVAITVNNAAYTVTLPGAVTQGTTGLQGYSGGVITFNSTGTFVFDFSTSTGGTTITIKDVTRANNVLTNPLFLTVSEDLAPSAAASLTKTTSYFTTAAAETATLAAGSEGQIKVFSAVNVSAGNMVITVTNPGWSASATGTATFSSRGAGCTLQYTNARWYCIGNNGVTFA